MIRILTALCFLTVAGVGALSSQTPRSGGSIMTMTAGEQRISRLGPATYVLKIDRKNAGSAHLIVWMEKIGPGHRVPVHTHAYDDETVLVHDGQIAAYVSGRRAVLAAGDLLFAPRGTLLGFQNASNRMATLFFIMDRPGFDDFLRATSVPAGQKPTPLSFAERKRLASHFGITYRANIPIVK